MVTTIPFPKNEAVRKGIIGPWTERMLRREFALSMIVRMCEDESDYSDIRDMALFGLDEDREPSTV